MRRIVMLALVTLAACSPSFSAPVDDFAAPIANSLGRVCWVPIDTTRAPTLRSATYRAIATYDPGALALTDRVELQILGRHDAPDAECTGRDASDDVPLSEPFELEREASQPIEVGGATFGADLAALVNDGTFWLGASAAGNVGLSEQTVRFTDGRITVGF